MKESRYKKIIRSMAVFAIWMAVWQVAAWLVSEELVLPAPLTVLQHFCRLATTAEFWLSSFYTLMRIMIGFLSAVVCGGVLAVLTCRFVFLDALLRPVIGVIRATPVSSFIIITLIWLTTGHVPTFIAFLMVLPIIWTITTEGIRNVDVNFLEVAKVFKFGSLKTVKTVYIPTVMPYFISACMTGLGLAWKAGVAAEVLATPKLSIGTLLYESKIYLETADLFAGTAMVIVLSILLEKLLSSGIKRVSYRYKKEE